MKGWRQWCPRLGLLVAAGVLVAASPPGFESGGLKRLSTETSVVALPGGRFRLSDGRTGRLAGILVPRRAPAGPSRTRLALAIEADANLRTVLTGAKVELWVQARVKDRYGDIVAHLRTERGVWLQAHLLGRGLARVRTRPDDRALAAAMLAIEGRARAARRGLWALDEFRVRADSAVEAGRFQIVEGRVHDVAERRRVVYVNFSRDWRRDFTLRIDRRTRRLFERAGFALTALKGRRVRVRGWVVENNGPMIDVTHPAQVERLDAQPRPAARP